MTTDRRFRGLDPATHVPIEVVVRDGRVVSVSRGDAVRDVATAHGYLAPGLVDLQVNGFGGFDVNGPDVDAEVVVELTRALASVGTTTFVPTVVTAGEADVVRSLRAVAGARARDPATRRAVPYAHVEGPHVSTQDGARGAHPATHVRPPDVAELRRWQESAEGVVGMVTLSPHHASAPAYTADLTRSGLRVAIGHTHATPEQVRAVVDAGAVLSTHLGNGLPATVPRHPNLLWTQLSEDRLVATFIADGHHLPADALTAMVRAKGVGRSVLVSDSVSLAGMPPGVYDAPVGGRVELATDGRLSQVGTPYLAGAARPLADGVAGAVDLARVTLADAVTMATLNPGRFANGRGVLRPAAPADLILFDWSPGDSSLRLRRVVQHGRVVLG